VRYTGSYSARLLQNKRLCQECLVDPSVGRAKWGKTLDLKMVKDFVREIDNP